MKKIGVVSLGCSKNRVDSEMMMGFLVSGGYELTNDPAQADIIIVNTCGFIESAKQESINTILEMAQFKSGKCKKLVVTGCLAQRYRQELAQELPEVDVLIGVKEYDKLVSLLNKDEPDVSPTPQQTTERVLTTPSYWAYLRIADGCDNRCSYCAIPGIRGGYVSRPIEEIVREAESLVSKGVVELVVIAQDTTRYGLDLYGKRKLSELLVKLAKTDVTWIRLMYTYPDDIDDELLDAMQSSEKIVKYIDMPIQHAHDEVLKRMNRRGSTTKLKALMENIRRRDERFVLRTSFIVGFPGETSEQFDALCTFVRQHPFDRAGAFTYSPEESTPSCEYEEQLDEDEKQRRLDALMRIQMEISKSFNEKRIGKLYKVLIEGFDEVSHLYFGRSYAESAEIDGKILFASGRAESIGAFVNVRITDAKEYDLIGETVHESAQ